MGLSHNYYLGRAEADVSAWLEYFCSGMAEAFENVYDRAKSEKTEKIGGNIGLRELDVRQKKVLGLFQKSQVLTAQNVAELFGLQPRTARVLCLKWVQSGFIVIMDTAKKSRRYRLAEKYEKLLK